MGRTGVAAVLGCVALVLAAEASAHGTAPGEGFRSTVSGIRPLVPGLLVRVLDGDKLSVRNWSGQTVVIEGSDGKALYRFADGAVSRRTEAGWRVVRRGDSHTWHEARVHWSGPEPENSGVVARFEIPGTAGRTPFVIAGFIGYRAPATSERSDSGIPAWAIVALVAFGLAVLLGLALTSKLRREGEAAVEMDEPRGSA